MGSTDITKISASWKQKQRHADLDGGDHAREVGVVGKAIADHKTDVPSHNQTIVAALALLTRRDVGKR
jgi:hypothetical protein